MKITLHEWLILPFVLWGIFQGVLYYNANQVEEAINIAIFEGSKQAAIQGRYTQEIYNQMLSYLKTVHKFDPTKIEIKGTESLTLRGEYLKVNVKIPKPRLHVISMFKIDSKEYFRFQKSIMSEYTVGP